MLHCPLLCCLFPQTLPLKIRLNNISLSLDWIENSKQNKESPGFEIKLPISLNLRLGVLPEAKYHKNCENANAVQCHHLLPGHTYCPACSQHIAVLYFSVTWIQMTIQTSSSWAINQHVPGGYFKIPGGYLSKGHLLNCPQAKNTMCPLNIKKIAILKRFGFVIPPLRTDGTGLSNECQLSQS